jgi:hypothetical protein
VDVAVCNDEWLLIRVRQAVRNCARQQAQFFQTVDVRPRAAAVKCNVTFINSGHGGFNQWDQNVMTSAITSTATSATDTSASAAAVKERALLTKLLSTYQANINKGQSADSLKALAKQINDTAKLLGQNVSLPKATGTPPTSGGTTSTPAEATTSTSKLNVKV